MKLNEALQEFERQGVPDYQYTVGGLGGGDVFGIEHVDGTWYTYFSERGSKNNRKSWATEAEAVSEFYSNIRELMLALNQWQDDA